MTLQKLRPLIPDWLFGAFCLLIPALYNSFPLVTADSGGYISNSYTLYLAIDRPVGYSVFIRLASMGVTLWFVVVVQALIVSALLLGIARHVLGSVYRWGVFAAVMLLVGIATSAGWTVGQLTPDVFTPILLLAVCVLVFVPCSKWSTWLLYLLIAGTMLVHNSNLLIGILLSVIMIVYAWKRKGNVRQMGIALLGISAVAWISLSAMNAFAGRGFRPSSASHVFLMSRMVENGIAETYLKDHCPTEPSSLCNDRNVLPDRQWVFMWDNNSPLYKAGGWQTTEKEYNHIILKTLVSPRYLGMHIVKNTQATVRQLPLIGVGDELAALGAGTSPYISIAKYFPDELKEYATAQQQQRFLQFMPWNMLIVAFALVVCIAGLLLPVDATSLGGLRGMLCLTVLFLLLNAAVTATFATVVARYEARVFWVLPFLATLYLIRRFRGGDSVY